MSKKSFYVLLIAFYLLAGLSPVRAQSSCELITPRIYKARLRLDTLKLDYPVTFAWVCSSLKSTPQNADPSSVVGYLLTTYTFCAALISTQDCNYVIGEFVDVLKDMSNLQNFARDNSCAVPSVPDPC